MKWSDRGASPLSVAVAEQLARKAIESADSADRRIALAGFLERRSQWVEIVDLLGPYAAENPTAALLTGTAFVSLGDTAAAIRHLQRALNLGRGDAAGLLLLCRSRQHGDEAVRQEFSDLLRDQPDNALVLASISRALLASNRADELLALCDDLAAQGVGHSQLLASMASATAEIGTADSLAELIDLDAISINDLGLKDDFNRRFEAEILSHPNRVQPDTRVATRGGSRVDRPLDAPNAECFRQLTELVCTALDSYEETLPTDTRLAPGRSGPVELNIWSVILGASDYETWHLHPAAILSGVYYVIVPPNVTADSTAGQLEFGLFGDTGSDAARRWRRLVMPVEGQVVLFPSSFAHRTVPTQDSSLRISVAFDVVAA